MTDKEPEPTNKEPEPTDEKPEPTDGLWKRVKTLLEGATALVALVVASVSLAFSLIPTLKPDEPPEKLGGTIVKAEVEPSVYRSDYDRGVLQETQSADQDTQGMTADTMGMTVRARVELSGYNSRHYSLRAELVDAQSDRADFPYAVKDGATVGVLGQDLRPSATTDAVTFQIWVRNPSHSGRYYVRLFLFDVGEGAPQDGRGDPGPMLDYFQTDAFTYRWSRLPEYASDARVHPGEGAYTVNGELPLGRYLLHPEGKKCVWVRLGPGSDPESAFWDEDAPGSGETTSDRRIVLRRTDRWLVMDNCGKLTYLGPVGQ